MERDSFMYQTAEWRGVPKFSCMVCAYYNFHNEAACLAHCRVTGHGRVKDGAVTVDDYIAEQANEPPRDVIITLGYLCWNTKVASMEGALALQAEAERLRKLGCKANVVVLDNGSTDGTTRAILDSFLILPKHFYLDTSRTNLGISAGRNKIIDQATELGSDYLLMMDGDIEIVPLSSYVMVRYLECHKDLGCIGAYSSNYTMERDKASKKLIEIPESSVRKDIHCAWTQYGMFRGEMFNQGMRFDESGPFGQPGWGFEDDDLCWQMYEKNWGNRYFNGMRYLHRNIRSSWPNLEQAGVDIPAMFKKRKDYLVDKWKRRGFDSAKIQAVTAQQMPVRMF